MYPVYKNQLQLDLSKSGFFYFYIVSVSLLCACGLLLAAIDFWLKILLASVILTAVVFLINARHKLISITWKKANCWQLVFVNGDTCEASILDNSFVSRFICVLNFRLGNGKKISYTIFPDSISPEKMRRLLVRFNIEKAVLFKK